MSKPRRFPIQAAIALAVVTVFSAARPAPGSQPVERNGATTQRRGVKAEKMAGPWKSTEVVCAALRKSICKEWVEQFSPAEPDSDAERPRATCSRVEVPVQGALRPPYLEVQGLRATCGLQGGSTVGQVRLVVRMADGFYLGPVLRQELEDRKVNESTTLRAVSMQDAADTPLLAALVQHRCVLLPAKLDAGLHELTMDHEQLVVIGSGPSGRPSAIAQDLGATLSLRTLPDLDEDSAEGSTPRKKHRGRASQTVLNDVINIGWHILPGPALHLDEPQGLQDIKPSRAIPDDIPCADSPASLRQRLHRAHRLQGSYLMIFR